MKRSVLFTLALLIVLTFAQSVNAETAFDSKDVSKLLDSNSSVDTISINPPGTVISDDNDVTKPMTGNGVFDVKTSSSSNVKAIADNEKKDEKVAESKTEPKAEQKSVSKKITVKKGDSLWRIAQRTFGDGSKYKEIIEANKDKYPSLVKNPDLIQPGWELIIPGEEEKTAESSANSSNNSSANILDKSPQVKKDKKKSSDADKVKKLPNFTTAEKISKMQRAVDAANRRLFAQRKKIGRLTASSIRFLIKNSYLSEEEWMAMNPPAGYIWTIDKNGKVSLVTSNGKELSKEEAKKVDEKIAKKAKEAEKAQAAKEKKKNELKEKIAKIRADAEKRAKEKEGDKKNKADAEKKATTKYGKMIASMGIPDFFHSFKDYNNAISAGSKLMSKGFFGGETPFDKFKPRVDPNYIPDLQAELKFAQRDYEEAVNNKKTKKFLGIFGDTIESTSKRVAELKARLEKHWKELQSALKQADEKAAKLKKVVSSSESTRKSLQKELDSLDKYDSSNSSKIQELLNRINDINENDEYKIAKYGLADYNNLKKVFK